MAGGDLRALFRTNDADLRASEAFTNRRAQWEAVAGALADHLRQVTSPGFDVEDLEAPRANVLVFHGVGGIGKTTLSRRLEAALAEDGHRPAQWERTVRGDAQLLPVRVDMARSANVDFERLVLTIRLALVRLGRPLPAFDLALRRYWEHQHPGESLEEYLRSGGLAGRYGQALPEQIQSVLGDVAQALALPGTVGSLVGQVTGSLVGALRERRQTVRALAGCRRLADLLEAEPDLEALSFYPHLLAWELAQLPADKKVMPVVLLDTFEDVGDRTHRDLERLIQLAPGQRTEDLGQAVGGRLQPSLPTLLLVARRRGERLPDRVADTEIHQQRRKAHSSRRIRVEHGIAHLKNWRALTHHHGRREHMSDTIQAVAALLSHQQAVTLAIDERV